MKLIYSGSNVKLNEAVKRANTILSDNMFYIRIGREPFFTHTDVSPKVISNAMFDYGFRVYVKDYWKPWGFALAYFTAHDPDSIYINVGKLNRATNSVVNTCIHEAVHVVDNFRPTLNFGHADNSNTGKEQSAPYRIGMIAEIMAYDMFGWDATTPTVWQRVKNFFKRILV